MGLNQTQCLRPCYDCPFRKDISPYQGVEDVNDNLRILTARQDQYTVCHHTSKAPAGERNSDNYGGKKLVCAGFLIMRQKLGFLLPSKAVQIPDRDYVFGNLREFQAQATCPDQSQKGRLIAWSQSQPRTKLLRRYAEAQAYMEQLVEQLWWKYMKEGNRGDYY